VVIGILKFVTSSFRVGDRNLITKGYKNVALS